MKSSLVLLPACLWVTGVFAFAQSVHYLDCESGNDTHDSLSPASAWKTVARASGYTFQPGDTLLLKRGTACPGLLWPKGSGSAGKAIKLGAYGVGELPKIVGAGNEAGLKLYDQQYWHIEHLDITGGNPYGIVISGIAPTLSHFRISDLIVHDVTGEPKSKDSGLIVIAPAEKAKTLFNDIVIDGVTAYNTTQWAGIIVNGANFSDNSGSAHGTGVTVRNSIVHDVGGDGILLARVKNGLIERNVSWNTGLQYSETIGTPDGIWEWMCEDCVVQYNEGFFSDSPGVDGGVFDIDYGNINNIVQYNFAHDSQGYCVSIFGAEGASGTSRNSTIRRNLCVNNGRSPRLAKRQGAIYLSTWNGGRLDGFEIYGNTIYWDPPLDTAAIVNEADIENGDPKLFSSNLIFSKSSSLVRSNSTLDSNDNLYWIPEGTSPSWIYGGSTFSSLPAFQSATGQEQRSLFLNPRLGKLMQPTAQLTSCDPSVVRTQDIYGASAPTGICAPGAIAPNGHQPPAPAQELLNLPLLAYGKPYSPSGWTLLAVLAPEGQPGSDLSRSQFVVLQSMVEQFAALGLHVAVAPSVSLNGEGAVNWSSDWNFGKIQLLTDNQPRLTREALGLGAPTGVLLISPERRVVRAWTGLTPAAEIELTLRPLLGTPDGMQDVKVN